MKTASPLFSPPNYSLQGIIGQANVFCNTYTLKTVLRNGISRKVKPPFLYTLLLVLCFSFTLPAQQDSAQNKKIRGYSVSAQGGLYADSRSLYGWTAGGEISHIRGRHIFSFSYRYLEEVLQQDLLGPIMDQYDLYTILYGMYFDYKEHYRFQAQAGYGILTGFKRVMPGEGLYKYNKNRSRGFPVKLGASYRLNPYLNFGFQAFIYIDAKQTFYMPLLNMDIILSK